MRGLHPRKLVTLILSILFLLPAGRAILGQNGCTTPWTLETWLNGYSNGQVGLAVLNNHLVVTWGDSSTYQLKAAVFDGTNWTYPSLPGFPNVMAAPAPGTQQTFGGGGVSMTASTACNAAYVAWVDGGGQNIWAVKYDGTNWTLGNGGYPLYTIQWQTPSSISTPTFSTDPPPPYYFSTASPALFGANTQAPPGYSSALPIGFAFPQYWAHDLQQAVKGSSYYTYIYGVTLGQSDCNLATVQVGNTNECLFWNGSTCVDSQYAAFEFDEGFKTADRLSGPWSPLWTGAVVGGEPYELRALAMGNSLGNVNPPIWYAIGSPNWYDGPLGNDGLGCVGTDCVPGAKPYSAGQWTNDGIGGAVNPADGTAWLVWSCGRYFDSDTCNGTPYFELCHVTTEGTPGSGSQQGNATYCTEDPGHAGSGEAAYSMPAMTFWGNQLWLAWQSSTGQIIVASIPPGDIGWNGWSVAPTNFQQHQIDFGSGQGMLEWSTTSGTSPCPGPNGSGGIETWWSFGVYTGFGYVDGSGTRYQLSGGAIYYSQSGCPPGFPNGAYPATLQLGPTGANDNITITFTPEYGGYGTATIN